MLGEIADKRSQSQIILTTHNSLIASRLNLKNVLWITKDGSQSLNTINEDDAKFFVKAENNSFLHLLLSEKAFLVEGNTEFLLLPKFYKEETGKTLEQDGISIISCGGISYKRYLSIIKETDKKIAIITDNDKKQKNIDNASEFNSTHSNQQIFMGKDVKDWTWEVCFFNLNQEALSELIKVEDDAEYLFNDKDYGQVLGKMLNNKTEVAYSMLMSSTRFNLPDYVKDAIKWIRK